MLTLALDTSSPVLTVAVGDGEKIIAETTTWLPRGHMAKLLPAIDGLLKDAGLTVHNVEVIVIGSGPGSYTGLRIGMVIARTLAQLLKVPILGIPSLDAIAQRNKEEGALICPVVDAKRGEVYAAFYRQAGDTINRFTDLKAIAPDTLAELLELEGCERIIFAGDGLKLYSDILVQVLGVKAELAAEDDWWPLASDLIEVARPRIETGGFDELYQLAPIYVRLSQAEELWEKRHRG